MKKTIVSTLCVIALTQFRHVHADEPDRLTPHVRSSDPRISALLLEGQERSPTFRALVSRIERSDGLVYVAWGPCPVANMTACLPNWMIDAGAARLMRIHLACQLDSRDRQIATLAHELQHAVEVLADRNVRSSAAVRSLFARIGSPSGSRSFETQEGVRTGQVVAHELSTPTVTSPAR